MQTSSLSSFSASGKGLKSARLRLSELFSVYSFCMLLILGLVLTRGGVVETSPTPPLTPTIELSQTYISQDNSLTFRYPEAWVIDATDWAVIVANNAASLINDQQIEAGQVALSVNPLPAEMINEVVSRTEWANTTLTPLVLSNVFASINQSSARLGNVTEITLDGRLAARMELILDNAVENGDELSSLGLILDAGNGAYISFSAAMLSGELELYEPILLAIAASANYTP